MNSKEIQPLISDRRAGNRHRGAAMIYVCMCMPFLFLSASLAVDYGRAQSAKTQLRAAVDAAARVAGQDLVNFLPNSTASADAISSALKNKVDGVPLTLLPSDIVFGTWNPDTSTFTANTAFTNAVQIIGRREAASETAIPTLLAAVMGRSSVDIRASATVYITQETAPFNALGDVTFNDTGVANGGSWTTDSYIGNTTTYESSTARYNGHLLTNGAVKYNFVTPAEGLSGYENRIINDVMGTIYSANGQDCTYTWTRQGGGSPWVEYGGWNNPGPATSQLGSQATFPTPVMPQDNTNPTVPSLYLSGTQPSGYQDLIVSDGNNVTLPGGIYTLNSLSITNGSTVTFSGPVTLNVATNVTIDSAAIVGSSNNAKCVVINACNTTAAGTNNVAISGLTKPLYADLNAPLANCTVTQPNNGNGVYGRIYSNNLTVNCNGNGGFHGDESLLMAFHVVK